MNKDGMNKERNEEKLFTSRENPIFSTDFFFNFWSAEKSIFIC